MLFFAFKNVTTSLMLLGTIISGSIITPISSVSVLIPITTVFMIMSLL